MVKDQLNAALRPHGLFFAPELSTSNRATIGGMINTDASGQGSCTYGHETRNLQTSKAIYAQSWGRLIEVDGDSGQLLADGYSCRSQLKRLEGRSMPHPLQVLLGHLREVGAV